MPAYDSEHLPPEPLTCSSGECLEPPAGYIFFPEAIDHSLRQITGELRWLCEDHLSFGMEVIEFTVMELA